MLAGHIDQADIVGLEETFGLHGRGTEHFVIADADSDVTIVGSSEAFVVNALTDFADVLFDFVSIDHAGGSLTNGRLALVLEFQTISNS